MHSIGFVILNVLCVCITAHLTGFPCELLLRPLQLRWVFSSHVNPSPSGDGTKPSRLMRSR